MIRLLGAIFIAAGCGSIGFITASRLLHEISATRNLISALEYWQSALTYHHTTLPELCRLTSSRDASVVGEFFRILGYQFEEQGMSDASQCIASALTLCTGIPTSSIKLLQELGKGLGEFDINGQLQRLTSVLEEAKRTLTSLSNNLDVRLRSYRTLGICAGIAIAILII